METMIVFGKNLKKIRKLRGMTQVQMADKLNVCRVTYVQWESGKRTPPFTKLDNIADTLGVKVVRLFVSV